MGRSERYRPLEARSRGRGPPPRFGCLGRLPEPRPGRLPRSDGGRPRACPSRPHASGPRGRGGVQDVGGSPKRLDGLRRPSRRGASRTPRPSGAPRRLSRLGRRPRALPTLEPDRFKDTFEVQNFEDAAASSSPSPLAPFARPRQTWAERGGPSPKAPGGPEYPFDLPPLPAQGPGQENTQEREKV